MKLFGKQAARYFATMNFCHKAILIFGSDGLRVANRRDELILAYSGKNAAAEMRNIYINATDVHKDSTLLLDALNAIGFFIGRRIVVLQGAGDAVMPAVRVALNGMLAKNVMLLVCAGSLGKASKLRHLFENAADALSIGIYDDPPDDQSIKIAIEKAQLTAINADAQNDLYALGRLLNHGDFNQMLQKLFLYKYGDKTPISLEDLHLCAPVSFDSAVDEVINAIADSCTSDVIAIIKRLFAKGVEPTGLCILTARHFKILHKAACHPHGVERAFFYMRPPIFGVRRQKMIRQCRRWGILRLEKALQILIDTDMALRSSISMPKSAIIERAFLRISLLCRR